MSEPIKINVTLDVPRGKLIEVIHEAMRSLPKPEPHAQPTPRPRDEPPKLRLCRRAEVDERTGLSATTLYSLISEDRFPRPVRMGMRSVAWVESEITDWIEARIAERDDAETRP